MNDIASVEFEASSAIFFDPYERNRTTGSFILIDPLSNATVGAGMIQEEAAHAGSTHLPQVSAVKRATSGAVTLQERVSRHGHSPALVLINNRPDLADRLERLLFENNFEVVLLRQKQLAESAPLSFLSSLWNAGFVILYLATGISVEDRNHLSNLAGEQFIEFAGKADSADELFDRVLAITKAPIANGGK
jgi:hypothetical protein